MSGLLLELWPWISNRYSCSALSAPTQHLPCCINAGLFVFLPDEKECPEFPDGILSLSEHVHWMDKERYKWINEISREAPGILLLSALLFVDFGAKRKLPCDLFLVLSCHQAMCLLATENTLHHPLANGKLYRPLYGRIVSSHKSARITSVWLTEPYKRNTHQWLSTQRRYRASPPATRRPANSPLVSVHPARWGQSLPDSNNIVLLPVSRGVFPLFKQKCTVGALMPRFFSSLCLWGSFLLLWIVLGCALSWLCSVPCVGRPRAMCPF